MMTKEIWQEAKVLVEEWTGKEGHRVPAEVITRIFNVHNKIFWESQEHSKGCGGCRERVWNKLKGWYWANTNLY